MNKHRRSRRFSFLVVFTMLFALTSCGASDEKVADDTTSESAVVSASVEPTETEEVTSEDTENSESGINIVYLPVSKTNDEDVLSYTYDSKTRTLVGIVTNSEGTHYTSSSVIYNEYGEVVEDIWYNEDGSTYRQYCYSYDESGNVVEDICYILHDGVLKTVQHFSYSYDEDGNKTEVNVYNDDGSINGKTSYIYDDHGYSVKMVYMSYTDGNISRQVSHEYANTYDEDGRITSREIYRDDGNVQPTMTVEYDDDWNYKMVCYKNYDGENVCVDYIEIGDKNGNTIEHYDYDESGNIEYQYMCEYDENGNRAKKITYYAEDDLEETVTCTWQAIEFEPR